ncbi:MAG: hypothetical protein ACJA1Q_003149 [Pseudohongiellaceae bacterium]|jgi:hypothetical protein
MGLNKWGQSKYTVLYIYSDPIYPIYPPFIPTPFITPHLLILAKLIHCVGSTSGLQCSLPREIALVIISDI